MTESNDRPWLAAYPAGIPFDIDPSTYPSLPSILDQAAERHPDHPAYVNLGVALTYREAADLTKHFAAYLQSLGLEPGDRVAIMMPNLLQYVVTLFAVMRAGFIVVNINPLYTSREVHQTLRDSGAKAAVIIENFARTFERALPDTSCKHVVVTAVGDLFPFVKRTLVNFVVKRLICLDSIVVRTERKLEHGLEHHVNLPVLHTTAVHRGILMLHGILIFNNKLVILVEINLALLADFIFFTAAPPLLAAVMLVHLRLEDAELVKFSFRRHANLTVTTCTVVKPGPEIRILVD